MARGRLGVAGVGLGAALMYFLDPERGRRRRKLFRDQLSHGARRAEELLVGGATDLRNRADGLRAEISHRLSDEIVSDDVLAARVRARLGRLVSHPHAVEVLAERGRVTLRGPVLADEARRLCNAVLRTRGVLAVDDQLEPHAEADVPALQGGRRRVGPLPELAQRRWGPGARLLAGGGGLALATWGLLTGGLESLALVGTGAALLGRGAMNVPLDRLFGTAPGREGIDFQKTLHVSAPVSEVFGYLGNPVNFPCFMQHVERVDDRGGGRYHWVVSGPGGLTVDWDSEVTRKVDNELITWESVEGAAMRSTGRVRFVREEGPDGKEGCRLDIRMSYNPPGGALTHALFSLFGANPKHALDQDMLRFKSLLEEGKATAHGRTVTRDQLLPPPGA